MRRASSDKSPPGNHSRSGIAVEYDDPAERSGSDIFAADVSGLQDEEEVEADQPEPAISESLLDPVFVGLDVEWKQNSTNKYRNVVLSYGLALIVGNQKTHLFVRPKGETFGKRYTLKQLLGRVIQKALNNRVLKSWPKSVYVCVHYGRGDLAALRDFHETLRPQLKAVQNTLSSGKKWVKVDILIDEKSGLCLDHLPRVPSSRRVLATDESYNKHIVDAYFFDSCRLAPEGASLEALGTLLGVKKYSLPAGYTP